MMDHHNSSSSDSDHPNDQQQNRQSPSGDDLNNDDQSSNEIDKLRKELTETKEKLMKFKNFVVTLRDERNQLKDKVNNDNIVIEKLKSSLKNQANTSQLFHNFQVSIVYLCVCFC